MGERKRETGPRERETERELAVRGSGGGLPSALTTVPADAIGPLHPVQGPT